MVLIRRPLERMLVLMLGSALAMQSLWADPTLSSYRQAREAFLEERAKDPAGSGFSAAELEVMQQAAQTLARDLPDPGIKTGQQAPDFTLPNAFGRPLRLYDQLQQGPVVLVFYRGAWCPFCNMHLRALQQSLPEFQRLGARLVLVTPQKPDKSREQLLKSAAPFEVLSDLDSSVMKAYRLYFELDPELASIYRKHGLDLIDYNGPGREVLPVPGTFVIDAQGVVRAMHADTDYMERMEPETIIAALEKLDKPKSPRGSAATVGNTVPRGSQ